MKKSLIVGSASLALAAMPVVGVFATAQTETITDTLEVKVQTACEFVRYGVKGATEQTGVAVDPSWDGEDTAPGDQVTGKYSVTIIPGADPELGTSHFTAFCNATNGYTVTVATPALVSTSSSSDTIPFSGTTVDATSGQGWTLTKNGTTQITATGATFMSNGSATYESSPDEATATYKVYTNSTVKAGVYTGDVVYTFTYDDPTL